MIVDSRAQTLIVLSALGNHLETKSRKTSSLRG